MKKVFAGISAIGTAALIFIGCSGGTGDQTQSNTDQGGGSMAGAGGAGPGFDGTSSGQGKYGTIPESGAASKRQTGHSQTNTALPSASGQPPVPTPPQPTPSPQQ
ncbi:MAG TPA: hypothetical protein VF773_06385 [Verrucomicrobiae bacterium]